MSEHSEALRRQIDNILAELGERARGSALSQLFRRVLDATDNTIVIADARLPDQPLIYVNKGFERLTGYAYDEAVGRNCRFLQGDDREQPGLNALRAAVREGRNVRVELRNYRKDGSLFWNEVHLTAVYDDAGELTHFFGVQNDITDLKLRLEDERFLRRVLEDRLALVAVLAPDGRIERFDVGPLAGSALAQAELVGQPFAATRWWRQDAATRDALRRGLERARAGETSRADLELHLGDTKLVLELQFTPRFDRQWDGTLGGTFERDEVSHLVVTGVDVSERKRAEGELHALTEELEARVEARAQEVRRLLGELTLAENRERHRIAQLLHDEVQQEIYVTQFMLGDFRKALARFPEAARALEASLAELNSQLRTVVREARGLTSDLSPPVLREEGFHGALGWVVARMREQHGLKVALTVTEDVPPPPEPLRVLLVSVVRELLFNVVKHAGSHRAALTVGLVGDALTLQLCDDGRGFDPSAIREATGLGLFSISERLRLFGGSLALESAPAQGTSITIRVPLASLRVG